MVDTVVEVEVVAATVKEINGVAVATAGSTRAGMDTGIASLALRGAKTAARSQEPQPYRSLLAASSATPSVGQRLRQRPPEITARNGCAAIASRQTGCKANRAPAALHTPAE